MSVSTKSINSKEEHLKIDNLINELTKKAVALVAGAEDYGIMTACIIDGEFVLVADYELTEQMFNDLEEAAKDIAGINADINSWFLQNEIERPDGILESLLGFMIVTSKIAGNHNDANYAYEMYKSIK